MKKGGKGGAPDEVLALGKVLAALQVLDEKQRAWVISSAITNLEIAVSVGKGGASSGTGGGASGSGTTDLPGTPGSKEHAKAFLRQRNPQNDIQRVACLAYYLGNHKNTLAFKTKDLTAMNDDAAGTAIGNMSQAVDNATKSHYFAPAGKGKKRLSSFGESIVDALPDQRKVKEVTAAQRPKKRKGRKKKAM